MEISSITHLCNGLGDHTPIDIASVQTIEHRITCTIRVQNNSSSPALCISVIKVERKLRNVLAFCLKPRLVLCRINFWLMPSPQLLC